MRFFSYDNTNIQKDKNAINIFFSFLYQNIEEREERKKRERRKGREKGKEEKGRKKERKRKKEETNGL